MEVTLGGDRLGSGNKNKIALRNYERSTHNLSRKVTTSMQCGVLYPFSVRPAMRGDTFTIDVDADARTIPTKGPLFGSFKMQIDYFQCPFRLYQAILHNNPQFIGLNMRNVLLPTMSIPGGNSLETCKTSNTSLLKYLGLSGIGHRGTGNGELRRSVNAIPLLAYYDIFKTYYANKQEENAYVIGQTSENEYETSITVYVNNVEKTDEDMDVAASSSVPLYRIIINFNTTKKVDNKDNIINITVKDEEHSTLFTTSVAKINTISIKELGATCFVKEYERNNKVIYLVSASQFEEVLKYLAEDEGFDSDNVAYYNINGDVTVPLKVETLKLLPFNLKNIDDMRLALLSKNNLGVSFKIGGYGAQTVDWDETSGTDQTGLPYIQNTKYADEIGAKPANMFPLNGLLVKTYQSDLFNNWVRTEWIDGENGIAAVTSIDTTGGSILIDTLNLSEKLYNMLNRIAVSDGSYEGWQNAVYTESPKRHIESPVYLGGTSHEIVFEEIVQTSESTDAHALGTLGGKGICVKRKGGHIHVKVDEASFIIGIVSLTPRINQTQGNEWYLTDLKSMDDLHKPALDGIGFQNLIGEQMAWFDTEVTPTSGAITRHTIGKVPAWINYMTDYDRGYGDFAETDGKGFMLLQRNYEYDVTNKTIKDPTTYIDPQKYNYAFAYTELDAQNFWVQIHEKCIARRLMSAKQIPNI